MLAQIALYSAVFIPFLSDKAFVLWSWHMLKKVGSEERSDLRCHTFAAYLGISWNFYVVLE